MKTSLFTLILFLNTVVFCQDWQPYPLMQKTYYISHDSVKMLYVQIDSFKIADTAITYYNNKKPDFPFFDSDSCYAAMTDLVYGYNAVIDSFMTTSNAIYYYAAVDEEPFVLYTDTTIGTSWNIYNTYPYSDFDYITVTYDSVSISDFYGYVDSVKFFSIAVDATLPGDHQIDDLIIKLSKSYGLLEQYPFNKIIHASENNDYYSDALFGLIKGIDTIGSIIPKWSDYWQLQPGDILKFKSFSDYMGTSSYWIVTISQVEKYEDSVLVTYSGGIPHVYYKKAWQYVFEAPPGAVVYSPITVDDTSGYTPDYNGGGEVDNVTFNNYMLPGTLIQERTVNASWELGPNCYFQPPFEGGIYFDIDTYCGITGYKTCSADYGCDGYYLVGSILSGVNYGNVTIEEIEINKNTFLVFPNPANSLITIKNLTTDFNDSSYQIFNSSGTKVADSKLHSNEIDVSNLMPGIYFIQLNNRRATANAYFIKM